MGLRTAQGLLARRRRWRRQRQRRTANAAAATAAADQQQPAPLTGPNTTPYYPVSAKVPYNDAVMEEHRHARSYRKLYAQQHGMLEAVAGTFTSGAVSFYHYSSQLTPYLFPSRVST